MVSEPILATSDGCFTQPHIQSHSKIPSVFFFLSSTTSTWTQIWHLYLYSSSAVICRIVLHIHNPNIPNLNKLLNSVDSLFFTNNSESIRRGPYRYIKSKSSPTTSSQINSTSLESHKPSLIPLLGITLKLVSSWIVFIF